jgi:hypothetical protein
MSKNNLNDLPDPRKKTLCMRDYEELCELLRIAHRCTMRAAYLLIRESHIQAADLKKLNSLLWQHLRIPEKPWILYLALMPR